MSVPQFPPSPSAPTLLGAESVSGPISLSAYGLSDAMSSAAPGVLGALLRLLEEPQEQGLFVRLPRQQSLLLVRRQTTPREIVEFAFDPDSGRFDCTACLCLPPPPPLDPSTDGGFARVALQALTGATAVSFLQASPFTLDAWQGWFVPDASTDVVDLGLPLASSARRVNRKSEP